MTKRFRFAQQKEMRGVTAGDVQQEPFIITFLLKQSHCEYLESLFWDYKKIAFDILFVQNHLKKVKMEQF